jgi:hypothetical protein
MNNIFTPVIVDGMEFAVKWHDFGSYLKMNVFQNDKLIGSKQFPIATDTGDGVVTYAIRSLLKAKDGKAN